MIPTPDLAAAAALVARDIADRRLTVLLAV